MNWHSVSVSSADLENPLHPTAQRRARTDVRIQLTAQNRSSSPQGVCSDRSAHVSPLCLPGLPLVPVRAQALSLALALCVGEASGTQE